MGVKSVNLEDDGHEKKQISASPLERQHLRLRYSTVRRHARTLPKGYVPDVDPNFSRHHNAAMSASAIALNRFGVGAGSAEPIPPDPRRWLLSQIDQYEVQSAPWKLVA